MVKVFLTGSTGFVGSKILRSFVLNPFPEIALTASCRSTEKLSWIYNGDYSVGDIADIDYVNKATKGFDVVCHVASWAELNGSVENSESNFLKPTLNLIDAALKNGVKRFIFLSAITSNPIERGEMHTRAKLSKIWPHYNSIMKIESYLEEISNKGMQVVILRAGYFIGEGYSLGLLPVLLPRLKTGLVPYIEKGETSLPLIDGNDLASAFLQSMKAKLDGNYLKIDVVGKNIPKVKDLFEYLHVKYRYPLPRFSVSYKVAYLFGRSIRFISNILRVEPLLVPSVVLLLEETNSNNDLAKKLLGFQPIVDWKVSVDIQIVEMKIRKEGWMPLNKT